MRFSNFFPHSEPPGQLLDTSIDSAFFLPARSLLLTASASAHAVRGRSLVKSGTFAYTHTNRLSRAEHRPQLYCSSSHPLICVARHTAAQGMAPLPGVGAVACSSQRYRRAEGVPLTKFLSFGALRQFIRQRRLGQIFPGYPPAMNHQLVMRRNPLQPHLKSPSHGLHLNVGSRFSGPCFALC